MDRNLRNTARRTRTRVPRKLFEDDRHDQNCTTPYYTSQDVTQMLSEAAQQDQEQIKRKWNIDLSKLKPKPLPGRYKWRKLSSDKNVIPVNEPSSSASNYEKMEVELAETSQNLPETLMDVKDLKKIQNDS